jgi:hypothetical protein
MLHMLAVLHDVLNLAVVLMVDAFKAIETFKAGSVDVKDFAGNRLVWQPGLEGAHRPDQGGSCGDSECGVRRGASDRNRSHGSRAAQEEYRCRHACGRRRHGFLSPTIQSLAIRDHDRGFEVPKRIPISSAGAVAQSITWAAASGFSQALCGHPHDIASSGSFRSCTERLEVTAFPASPQGLPHEVNPPGPQRGLFWID